MPFGVVDHVYSFENTQLKPSELLEIFPDYAGYNPYEVRDDGVYLYDQKVLGADVDSFEYIGYGYAIDKDSVYFGQRIQDSDASSLKYIRPYPDNDSRFNMNVFLIGAPKMEKGYLIDKNNVYLVLGYAREFSDSFELDPENKTLKLDYVQFSETGVGELFSIPLLFDYFKSPFDIYDDSTYLGKVLNVDDISGFQVLGNHLSKDAQNVYFLGNSIDGVDVSSFEQLDFEESYYAKDKNAGYYKGKRIEGSVGDSFVRIKDNYAKDENAVYFEGNRILGANVRSFEIFPDYYGKSLYSRDDVSVYYRGNKIEGGDVDSFQVVNDHYSIDKYHVYFKGKILYEVDVETFEVMQNIGSGYAKDKNNVYIYGEIMEGIDGATFEYLGFYYSKDKNTVYYGFSPIDGVDLKTFEVISKADVFRDKYFIYKDGKKEKPALQDLDKNVSYRESIEFYYNRGFISGYSDNTFRPESTINRAELLKLLFTINEQTVSGNNCFPDVNNQWYAEYVCFAVKEGIVDGYSDGLFHPEKNISFVEASKIIARALGYMPEANSESIWYKPYVKYLEANEAIPTSIRSFSQLASRAEVVEMIFRMKTGYGSVSSNDANYQTYDLLEDLQSYSKSADDVKIVFSHRFKQNYNHNLAVEGVPDGINEESFEVLSLFSRPAIFADQERVYCYSDSSLIVFEGVERESFQVHYDTIFGDFVSDNRAIYKPSNSGNCYEVAIPLGDVQRVSNNIFVDEEFVYFYDYRNSIDSTTLSKVEGADAKTFKKSSVDDGVLALYEDEQRFYFYDDVSLTPLPFEKNTFAFVGSLVDALRWSGLVIFKDRHGVYAAYSSSLDDFEVFPSADIDTFEVMSISRFGLSILAKDKNAVYLVDEWGRVERYGNQHADTFVNVTVQNEASERSTFYFKDDFVVYSINDTKLIPLEWADPFTFQVSVLEGGFIYGKNESTFWYYDRNRGTEVFMPEINFDSFQLVSTFQSGFYAKDDQNVWYLDLSEQNVFNPYGQGQFFIFPEYPELPEGLGDYSDQKIISYEDYVDMKQEFESQQPLLLKKNVNLDVVTFEFLSKTPVNLYKDFQHLYTSSGNGYQLYAIEGVDLSSVEVASYKNEWYVIDSFNVWKQTPQIPYLEIESRLRPSDFE